jgi:hypothetical protein
MHIALPKFEYPAGTLCLGRIRNLQFVETQRGTVQRKLHSIATHKQQFDLSTWNPQGTPHLPPFLY